MSNWAEIDNNNKVIRVLVGDNNSPDEGEAFMNSLGGPRNPAPFPGRQPGPERPVITNQYKSNKKFQ